MRRDDGQREVPSTRECTAMFNEAMRAWWQDMGAYWCAKCAREACAELGPLEVSHFFNVRFSATRFDPRNVDPLHRSCHTGGGPGTRHKGWEYQKNQVGAYRKHMIRKLGEEGFRLLDQRRHEHMSLEEAKAELVKKLREGRLT